MKFLLSEKELEIPDNIEVEVKSRVVKVKGPLGTLTKNFRHVPFDMRKVKDEKTKKSKLLFQMWLQKRKQIAVLGSVRGTISNMIRGVTSGYKFKMVLAYAHFPIIANVVDGGKVSRERDVGTRSQELRRNQDEQEGQCPARSHHLQEGRGEEPHHCRWH